MTLVDLAQLNRALAERDAARAEVARLRAAVEGVDAVLATRTQRGPWGSVAANFADSIRDALDAAAPTDEASP